MYYKSIADAAAVTGEPSYAGRGAKVWYTKPERTRDYRMGPDWLMEHGIELPTPQTISDTHVLLGEIGERDPEKVYWLMQGESWSPRGEARNLIQSRGLGHTSMSVGDVVQVGSQLFMADDYGFHKIGSFRAQLIRVAHANPGPVRREILRLLVGA